MEPISSTTGCTAREVTPMKELDGQQKECDDIELISNGDCHEKSKNKKGKSSELAQRLRDVRERLSAGRAENMQAVDQEELKVEQDGEEKGKREDIGKRARYERQNSHGDEADGEDGDDRLRAMKRRARHVAVTEEDTSSGKPVTYGGDGKVGREAIGRMVAELNEVQRRRERHGRRRAVNDDDGTISFINEGNRLFNRTLERHYDKFESVQKIKDDLERGSA